MKKTILWLAVIMMLVMFFAGCKTADFVWNPLGNWTWTITGDWGMTWTETLTFTGSETGGSVIGWEYCSSGVPGTWTKTGDHTLGVTFDFWYTNDRDHLEFTGSSSEANPNSMTGTGLWSFYLNGFLDDQWTMTFSGAKTSNLQ